MKNICKAFGSGKKERKTSWLVVLLLLCSLVTSYTAWAQQGGNGGTDRGGDPGYDIMGEGNPKPNPDTYTYDQVQPNNDPQLYWSVAGAKTINGQPADSWREGSLLVHNYPSLQIQWRDSIQGGRLALRTKVPVEGQDGVTETQERFFWWIPIAVIFYNEAFCNPDIQWSTGSVYNHSNLDPEYENFSQSGLIYDEHGFCRSQVLTLRFKNRLGINCFGSARPYSWRFNYLTDQGHTYVETWSSTENIITPQFYQQVPYQPFTSGLAQLGGLRPEKFGSFGSALFTTATSGLTVYNGSSSSTVNPYQGERIIRAQVQAIGSNCGFVGSCGDLSATTGIIVYGLDAASNIAAREILPNNQLGSAIPAGQGLCVGRRYQVSASSDHALTFDWTTDLGSINAAGVTATLDLTQVTAANAPFQVQITATARAANQTCLSSPPTTTATFYFRDTPAPQNLRLDGNPQICSTPATRTIRVDPVAGATYTWQVISGPGSFGGLTTVSGQFSNVDLTFTGSGTVQIQVTAQDDCNRLSIPVTADFSTADPNAAPAPLAANMLQNYYGTLWNYSPRDIGLIPVSSPQNGITYTFQVIDTELFNQKQPSSPGATVLYFPSDPKTAGWGSGYTTLTQVTGGTSATIEILTPLVASVKVRVTAANGCGSNGITQTRDYVLTRPFHGSGMHLTADDPGEDSALATGTSADPDGASEAAKGTALAKAAADGAAPQLYPNPARDQLQIVAPSPATHYEYVAVLNVQGVVVREARSAEGVQAVSLKDLPTGIYAVRLFDGKTFVTRRIAKD